jgi:hypothetical protein
MGGYPGIEAVQMIRKGQVLGIGRNDRHGRASVFASLLGTALKTAGPDLSAAATIVPRCNTSRQSNVRHEGEHVSERSEPFVCNCLPCPAITR